MNVYQTLKDVENAVRTNKCPYCEAELSNKYQSDGFTYRCPGCGFTFATLINDERIRRKVKV